MKQGYAAPVHVNYDNDRQRSLARLSATVECAKRTGPPAASPTLLPPAAVAERERANASSARYAPSAACASAAREARGRKSPFSGTGRAARQSPVTRWPSLLVGYVPN